MEQSEGSAEHAERSEEQTERSERTEIPSEQRASEQTERADSTFEHAECSSEQPECSSEQPECSHEIPGCSKQTECSTEQTAHVEPAKDVGPLGVEWSEPWLEVLAEQLSRLAPLWRISHMVLCKTKSARGFAYIRLMSAMGQMDGDVRERLTRGMALCKDFFKLLRQKMRAAALECLDAGPEQALRRCPAWARRADSYLNNMPDLFTSLAMQRNVKRIAKKRVTAPPAAPAAPSPVAGDEPPSQVAGDEPPSPVAGGEPLMRRVVRGMRRAARERGGLTRAAAAAVAARLGETEERVFALWCGMRKLSIFKLQALLFRGDAPSESGRLDALDWAVVDLLIMYSGITLVSEASYQNYEQLSALLGTFHLVQRFGLERPRRRGLLSRWSEAARWYSRNRVQMSVLGLQKRWFELKLDTRRRMLSRLRLGARAPEPLPLHQAIARRYEHVVVQKEPCAWKRLVLEERVARPTAERGPAPGEPDVPRTKGNDESSDSDTAAAVGDDDDDDDLTIIEKTLETIDLSEDKNDEIDTPVPDSQVTRSLPSLEAESSENTNVSRQFDKTIDVNKEIVDLDSPSPKSNVLEALQGLDVDNIETSILFESDEEDTTSIDVRSVDNRASVNKDNESHDKGNRRESIDSEDGNLVIDCEDSNSAIDVRNDNTVWDDIEREMIPELSNNWAGVSGYNQSDTTVVPTHESTKESVSDETLEKYPLLTRMLQTKSVCDTFTTEKSPKVYYNTKRYHIGKAQKQYANVKVVSVGRKDIKAGPARSHVADSELSAARLAEGGGELLSEVEGEADGGQGESGEQQSEVGIIDPKLLMYAVVVLRRFEDEIPQILSLKSTPTPLCSRIDDEIPQMLSRHSTPTPLTRPSSRNNVLPEILSPPAHPSSRVDEEPLILSGQSAPPSPLLLLRESPPPTPPSPPNATIPPPHSHSLFHYYAANVRPKFMFLKRNIPLLKLCKPCSVVLRRMDLGERAERVAMNRVAKKVELPDIEEVRRNNRSMLTAQVAPLAPRREVRFGDCSSPEPPSCSSDSDWTPDPERPRGAEPHPALPDLAEPHSAEPHSAEPPSAESADEDAETDGGATSAELGQLLNDLLAEAGSDGDCNHRNDAGVRGPLASTAESCANCALRVLSAPPISGVEARLQRRLLRRLAKANQPTTTLDTTATSTTVTTIGGATTVPTIAVTTERKENSRKRRCKTACRKRRRPPSPPRPPPPPPRRARSPQDPEAAAREWLRQKNIAAEKFGVKPRSYKKPTPVVQSPEPPAILQPLATTSLVPQLEPPAVLKAMQATNQVPVQNQPFPRFKNFKIVMQEAIASAIPPADQPAQPFRIAPSPANKSAQSSNSILLNQGNTSTPLLNQTNPALSQNSAQTSSVSLLNQKKGQPLNNTARILNEIHGPSIFNPNAIADINKKLVTLAPTTEAETFGFHPVISNVHSLATPKTPVLKNLDANAKKDPKTQQKFIIIPASNPTGATSILLRSQESEVAKPGENVFTSPETSLPQVVSVTGGVHYPSAGVAQALHLIVSQNLQNITNINQPNMVVGGNMIQNAQQQVSVRPTMPNYVVTSMPQLVESQPLLVACTSLATPTTDSQPSALSSLPGRMVARSAQAGASQQNVSVQNVSQENSVSHHIVSQGNVVSQRNVSQQNVVSVQNVTQESSVSQGNVVSQRNVSQQNVVSVQNVTQESSVSHHIVSQGNVVSQRNVSQQNVVSVQNVTQENSVSHHIVSQGNVVSQRNVSQQNVVSVHNVSQENSVSHHIMSQGNPVLQQNALSTQNVSQHNAMLQQNVLHQHVVSQQNVSHHNPVSQQNVVSVQNVSQKNSVSHKVSHGNVVLQQHALSKQNVAQNNAMLQQNVSHQNPVSQQNVVSVQNVSQKNSVSHIVSQGNPVLQQHALSKQNVSQHNAVLQQNVLHQHVVSQQNASHQNLVSQQNAVSHIPTQASPAQGPNVAEDSDDANKASDPPPLGQMRPSLNWAAPPIPSHEWARGRDSTALSVLCSGPKDHAGWELSGHLLVSEEALPPSGAAYWATRPRTRLSLPGEKPFSPAKRQKADPDTSKTWLKVKAFARLAPEEAKDLQKDSPDSITTPPRVFVNDTVYQKLSDDPLVYAKLLVAVPHARACRALLARGAALQLYCLRTGKLFPLQAEPKEDDSRITLSGDEEVSSALVALARQLYKLPDTDPSTETPVVDAENKNTVDEALDRLEPSKFELRPAKRPSEAEPRPAKRPSEAEPRPAKRPAERRIAPMPPPPPPLVILRPSVFIDLSKED